MPPKTLLIDLIEEFNQNFSKHEKKTARRNSFPPIPNKIKVALGMRRTGKTVFLFQIIQTLLEKKTPMSQILYLNFEDDRIIPISQEKLAQLLDAFYSIYPENHDKKCYLFLDEIQNVENWHAVVRRYFDTKNIELYLTGSSAKLLSKEIATSLRGRSISVEIGPFSFQEYLAAKQIDFPSKISGKKNKDIYSQHLTNYLQCGGFPETIHLETSDRIRLLQDYVAVVIFRDIVERHKITNVSLIKYMIKSLLKNAAGSFSIHKFFNDLKSQGFSVGKMTLYDYLSYIEDAYLVFTVSLYSESIRKTETNSKKIYANDTGLINAYTMHHSHNYGHLFENLVYLDLRRKEYEIYYYLTQERYEVDFFIKDVHGKIKIFQVVWDMENKETMERETRALNAAEKELNTKGFIITPENYFEWLYEL